MCCLLCLLPKRNIQNCMFVGLLCTFVMSGLVIWQAIVMNDNVVLVLFNVQRLFFFIYFGMAIFMVVLVLYGLFITLCNHGCWNICVSVFSCVAFIWWLVFTLIGSAMLVIYFYVRWMFAEVCEGEDVRFFNDFGKLFNEVHIEGDNVQDACTCSSSIPSIQYCEVQMEEMLDALDTSIFDVDGEYTDQEIADYNSENPDKAPLPRKKKVHLFQ